MSIICSFTFEGFHNWPAAPPKHGYLKQRHRHLFHVTALKDVTDGDREIEFIQLKRDMVKYVATEFKSELGPLSCELLAIILCKEFDLKSCTVLEDGENGAIVESDSSTV